MAGTAAGEAGVSEGCVECPEHGARQEDKEEQDSRKDRKVTEQLLCRGWRPHPLLPDGLGGTHDVRHRGVIVRSRFLG